MRFALLGDHPDGIDLARTLAATGQHFLQFYSGPALGLAQLHGYGIQPKQVGDLEEILADDAIDTIIVAGSATARDAQLRRALQAECHVLCVHPAGSSPDIAYEASLLQNDTGCVLLPLLPMTLHPGVVRLAGLVRTRTRLIELEIWSTEEVLLDATLEAAKPGLPGWDVLRRIGGEIGEVYAQAPSAEIEAGQPLLVSGRFLNGRMFQASYLPHQAEARWRIALVTTTGRATLLFPHGWPGPATLTYTDESGETRTESWEQHHPWLPLIDRLEQALARSAIQQPGQVVEEALTKAPHLLGWEDELRGLELDDALRRSAERGRSSVLDHQEATEEASFKGTMTLAGCSLIWMSVAVLILSVWFPWLAWFILPLFAGFLLLQTLRWIVPGKENRA